MVRGLRVTALPLPSTSDFVALLLEGAGCHCSDRGESAATYLCEAPPAWVRGPFLSQSPSTDIPRCDYGHPGNNY